MRCKACNAPLQKIDYQLDELGELCAGCLSYAIPEDKLLEKLKQVFEIESNLDKEDSDD